MSVSNSDSDSHSDSIKTIRSDTSVTLLPNNPNNTTNNDTNIEQKSAPNKLTLNLINIALDDIKYAKHRDLVFGTCIGAGGYSNVLGAKWQSMRCAVKINDHKRIKPSLRTQELDVIRVLLNKSHKNIIKFFEIMDNWDKSETWILMEWIRGIEFVKHVEDNCPLDESVCRRYFRQLVDGLAFLHSLSIAHRDIKLENILIVEQPSSQNPNDHGNNHDNNVFLLKYIDFGFSRLVNTNISPDNKLVARCGSHVGTSIYMAPEVIDKSDNYYNAFKSDIYSLGILLYIMVYACFPYESIDVSDLRKLKQKPLEFKSDVQISDSLKQLLMNMCEQDSDKRFNLNQILDSDWMKN